MNAAVQQKLREIIGKYGLGLCDNPRRCEGLLRDLCPNHRREVSALIIALEEGIPAAMVKSNPSVPVEIALPRLVQQLVSGVGLSEEVSRWAVDTWALATGRITEDQLGKARRHYAVSSEEDDTNRKTDASSTSMPGDDWYSRGGEGKRYASHKANIDHLDVLNPAIGELTHKLSNRPANRPAAQTESRVDRGLSVMLRFGPVVEYVATKIGGELVKREKVWVLRMGTSSGVAITCEFDSNRLVLRHGRETHFVYGLFGRPNALIDEGTPEYNKVAEEIVEKISQLVG